MTATFSNSRWSPQLTNVALLAMITTITQGVFSLSNSSPSLVKGSLIDLLTVSKTQQVPGEIQSWEEMRLAKIKSIRGKYRNSLTPSSDFARIKLEEISLEG
jgi:hypothetical protein